MRRHSEKPALLSRRWRGALASTLAFAVLLPAAARAGQAGRVPAALDDMTAAGAQVRALAQRAGTWDVSITSWAFPGADPVALKGLVAERSMIGPMLQEILRSPRGGARPFVRADFLTFNRLEGRWQYMSMDSRVPDGMMSAWSLDADPENRIFVSFLPFANPDATDPASPFTAGRFLRMEQVIVRSDADHEIKDQYFTAAGSAPVKWLAMQYRYTRRR